MEMKERKISFGQMRQYAALLMKWLVLAGIIGIICGALGAAFHHFLEIVTEIRLEHRWLLWLLPVAGLAITALYKLLRVEGVGTNHVFDAVHHGNGLSSWLIPAVFLGTTMTHICGGSSGREGAALQMGGSVGYQLGKLFRVSDHERRTAVICGMAAFFSALFGTPLAATLFSLMVLNIGAVFYSAFAPALFSALTAMGIAALLGTGPTKFVVEAPALDALMCVKVAGLGLACAMVAIVLYRTMHSAEHWIHKWMPNSWIRAAVGGAVVVAMSLLVGSPRYNGAGMDVITAAIEQGSAQPLDWVLKLVFTAITLAVGFKGGEMVPTFFIGATFGCVVAPVLGIQAGFGAALGLIAVFCGATNSIIPSVFLAIELFGGDGAAYFAIACAMTYVCSGYGGLYHSQKHYTDKWFHTYVEEC